jgi:ABC-type nitrate/sulfonate/bicarbonate transport system permease component
VSKTEGAPQTPGATEAEAPPSNQPDKRPPPARARSPRLSGGNKLPLLLILVGVCVAWEILSRTAILNPIFVSYPTEILAAVPDLVESDLARSALAVTGRAIALACLYGTLLGAFLGYLLGFSRLLRDAFYGPALFLMSIPKSIFIPLFMIFVGINNQTAVYYGAFSAFIYVLINVVGGFDLVEPRHLLVARAHRASLWHRITDIILPASLPGLFTGIWYGLKNGLQGVLIVELFISVGGLGRLISLYTNQRNTDRVFALVIFVSVLAVLTGTLWAALEKRLSRWRATSEVSTVPE